MRQARFYTKVLFSSSESQYSNSKEETNITFIPHNEDNIVYSCGTHTVYNYLTIRKASEKKHA